MMLMLDTGMRGEQNNGLGGELGGIQGGWFDE